MSIPAIRTAEVASRNEENLAVALTTCSMTEELKPCSSSPSGIRRGEKVPATIGTVGDAFGLLDRGPLCGEFPRVGLGRAEFAAGGTGLFVGEFIRLLFEEQLKCSLVESLCGGGGDLLEGAEVHIESGSVVPEGPLGNNLCPACGEIVKFSQFLGGKSWGGHRSPCLEVAP